MTERILRGESVRPTVDYDLFDVNVKGKVGIYLKKDKNSGKCLVYFAVNKEWAELLEDQFERVSPGKVPAKNKKFVSNISEMKITFPTP